MELSVKFFDFGYYCSNSGVGENERHHDSLIRASIFPGFL